jgi:hypothetical protein
LYRDFGVLFSVSFVPCGMELLVALELALAGAITQSIFV